jgi:hypothetical protein
MFDVHSSLSHLNLLGFSATLDSRLASPCPSHRDLSECEAGLTTPYFPGLTRARDGARNIHADDWWDVALHRAETLKTPRTLGIRGRSPRDNHVNLPGILPRSWAFEQRRILPRMSLLHGHDTNEISGLPDIACLLLT